MSLKNFLSGLFTLYVPAGSNLSNRFKEAERKPGDGVGGKERRGTRAGGRGERVKRMGEGLFVHASHSLGVISIARSIIVPFEEGETKKIHRM